MADEEKEENQTFKEEVIDKFGALITAAFGLVAALAWRDTVMAIFAEMFGEKDAIIPMLIYAVLVTIIGVILIVIIARVISNTNKKID